MQENEVFLKNSARSKDYICKRSIRLKNCYIKNYIKNKIQSMAIYSPISISNYKLESTRILKCMRFDARYIIHGCLI